jgi:hypothetical protein
MKLISNLSENIYANDSCVVKRIYACDCIILLFWSLWFLKKGFLKLRNEVDTAQKVKHTELEAVIASIINGQVSLANVTIKVHDSAFLGNRKYEFTFQVVQ